MNFVITFSFQQSADTELLKVKMEVTRVNKEIDEIIENFEKQKNHDLKTLMQNFTLIQMKMHTKAIEVLTGAYYDIENIDEDKDLHDFQKIFRSKEKVNPKGSIKKVMRTAQSLENLGGGTSSGLSHFKVDRSTIKNAKMRLSRSNKDLSRTQTDDELDDEEEEDEEEEVSLKPTFCFTIKKNISTGGRGIDSRKYSCKTFFPEISCENSRRIQ